MTEQQNTQATRIYNRAEEICKLWAQQSNTNIQGDNTDDSSHHTSSTMESYDTDYTDINSTGSDETQFLGTNNNRNRFDPSTYDLLGRIIIVKVFSHQVNQDFTNKSYGQNPAPNLFVVPANQIADNQLPWHTTYMKNMTDKTLMSITILSSLLNGVFRSKGN
jgi:hypothetical protein